MSEKYPDMEHRMLRAESLIFLLAQTAKGTFGQPAISSSNENAMVMLEELRQEFIGRLKNDN